MALPLAVGLACGSSTPAAGPTQAPAATEAPASSSTSSSEQVTFTDQNKYLEFDLPGDWTYSQDKDTTNDYWYWDAFKSPDKHAGVESVVFDDGTAWTGGQSGKQALYMLHQFYSFTGKEGDIRISDDSMQKDGSERLTWESKGGKSKGISFFEVRKRTAFLMFTVWWDNDFESQYSDRLNAVIDSYRVP
jgi:hypothetical protein